MSKKKNVLIGVIALLLVVSTGAVAFAATGTDDTQQKKAGLAVMAGMTDDQRDAIRQARTDSMEEAVAELVEKGAITQDIADKLTEIKDIQAKDKSGIGALTEEQRTVLHDAEAAEVKNGIADLVEEGTITQEQADQLAQEQGHKMMKDLDLTDDQKTALADAVKAKFESKLSDLVDEDTITQEQADQLLSDPGALHMGPGGPEGHGGPGRGHGGAPEL